MKSFDKTNPYEVIDAAIEWLQEQLLSDKSSNYLIVSFLALHGVPKKWLMDHVESDDRAKQMYDIALTCQEACILKHGSEKSRASISQLLLINYHGYRRDEGTKVIDREFEDQIAEITGRIESGAVPGADDEEGDVAINLDTEEPTDEDFLNELDLSD